MSGNKFLFLVGAWIFTGATCKQGVQNNPPSQQGPLTINSWVTTANQSSLLVKQAAAQFSMAAQAALPTITVDDNQKFQGIDGFGYTITGGSAMLMQRMDAAARAKLIKELFGHGENDIRVNYIRLSIGASDLNDSVFTYNDLPAGQTDEAISKFRFGPDLTTVIPVIKEILQINPTIKILATPWSAPAWMKDNGKMIGGTLLPQFQPAYANYFVRYINEMNNHGITIDAITPQNEPLHPGNNPSMYMSWEQQRDFIKNNLGPALAAAGLNTKIIIYDHNLDHPEYATNILADPAANKYINGSAFHLYAGDISVMSDVHKAFPGKALYFTEQYTSSKSVFGDDLKWHIKNVIIGSVRNWSRVALQWNLANDPEFKPFTPNGGCGVCKGAITIDGNNYTRNVPYYVVAHASKFVADGSVRIASNEFDNLSTAAFLTPEGNRVLIALNDGKANIEFTIKYNNQSYTAAIPANSVVTYVW